MRHGESQTYEYFTIYHVKRLLYSVYILKDAENESSDEILKWCLGYWNRWHYVMKSWDFKRMSHRSLGQENKKVNGTKENGAFWPFVWNPRASNIPHSAHAITNIIVLVLVWKITCNFCYVMSWLFYVHYDIIVSGHLNE